MVAASSPRRIGTAESGTRIQLLDAAERLLIREGYAAVTSRRVGAEAGLKPQLVHYYFRTMDDLFVELFRRRAEENLARFEARIAEDASLGALWESASDRRGAALLIEFVALANHRKAVRAEVRRFAERYRAAQLTALTSALTAAGVTEIPPVAALLLMTGVTQVMALEERLGMKTGHAETTAFVEGALTALDRRA